MITTGYIFPFRRRLLNCLPVIVLLAGIPATTNAQSTSGLTSEQLAAADALADSGDTQNAIKGYRYIARSAPKSDEAPAAQFALAKQLKQSGSFDAAFKEYQLSLIHI